MNQPIKLFIAATSKRVDIANIVALTFFNNVELPPKSQLDVAMGWRDSELGGTGPALLVGKKKCDFGFGNPVGLSAMAYRGCGFYKQISAAYFDQEIGKAANDLVCHRRGVEDLQYYSPRHSTVGRRNHRGGFAEQR